MMVNRTIPITTRLGIFFGGILTQMGWWFFGFGLIFVWSFGLNADLSFIQFRGEVATVKGQVARIVATNSSENDRRIYEYHFVTTIEEGTPIGGVSYSSTNHTIQEGDTVTIEFPAEKPQYARIQGMRNAGFPVWVLFVVIFPLIGAIFIVIGLLGAIKTLRLLQYGMFTTATLVSKERTNTTINNQYVYKLLFRFADSWGNEHEFTNRTHRTYLVDDEPVERIAYLPNNPQNAIPLDTVQYVPLLDEHGPIEAIPINIVLLRLIVPVLTIVGHGAFILYRFVLG